MDRKHCVQVQLGVSPSTDVQHTQESWGLLGSLPFYTANMHFIDYIDYHFIDYREGA